MIKQYCWQKIKLNTTEVLISKALIDSCTCYEEFILVNDALTEYGDMKEEIKKLKTSTVHQKF